MMGNRFWLNLAAAVGIRPDGKSMVKVAAAASDPLESLEKYRSRSGGNVVSEEYVKQWETRNYVFRSYDFPSEQEAMRARSDAAKLLRSLGWEVKAKTVGFSDLARGRGFFLEARKARQGDPNKMPIAEATAKGFFKSAKSMGWGLYQVEELDGGLGSIWHVEKDAATGEQFLVKQVDPVGDIVRRVKTASVKIAVKQGGPGCFCHHVGHGPDTSFCECPCHVGHKEVKTASVKTAVVEGGGVDTPCKECGKPLGMAYFMDDLGICTDCVRKKHRDAVDPGWRKKKASIVVAEDESIVPQGKDDEFGDQDNLIVGDEPEVAPAQPMSDMVTSYLATALWAETDNSTESGGEPLDKNYTIADFAPEAVAKAVADCAAFEQKAGSLLDGIERRGEDVPDVIGFHFWLTRNGHGAGFWDGDYPKEIGDALTALSHEFGETDAYVGDDGKLHLS